MEHTENVHLPLWKTLKDKIENDSDFNLELQSLLYFYERKLLGLATTEAQRQHIMDNFEEVLFSQYFQGYHVMSNILSDKETDIGENTWTFEAGIARNEIPKFLKNLFEEVKFDWSHTEISHKFGMELLDMTASAYDIFKQIRIEIAAYAAYKAFIEDERYKGNTISAATNAELQTILGNPFNLEFLSPQVYMQATFASGTHEVWDLFNWSAISEDSWVGSIHLTEMVIDELSTYLLEIKMSNVIAHFEKTDLIHAILIKLPEEIQVNVQTRVYHVEDIEIMQYTPDIEE